jgi:hypothetical protein
MNSNGPDKETPLLRLTLEILALLILLTMIVYISVSLKNSAPLSTAPLATQSLQICDLGDAGYLRGRLYGALAMEINWHGARLACDGLLRPERDGIRLFFSPANPDGDARLVVVIGISGKPHELEKAEHAANITLIDEAGGRIFSSSGQDRCWTTVTAVTVSDNGSRYRVEGTAYCAGALPALNEAGSVTLDEFSYAGRLNLQSL